MTTIHWLTVFVFSGLSVGSQMLQIFMKPQIKVIDADYVWELSQERIQAKGNIHDRYISQEADLGSSDKSSESSNEEMSS